MKGREVTLELLGTNEQEIAYLAGFFDGEGSVTIQRETRKSKEWQGVVVSIGVTTPEPLFIFKRIFGGAIQVRQPQGIGRKMSYHWRLQGRKAELFLRVIEPYALVKKDKILLSLSLLSYYGGRSPGRAVLADKISKRRVKKGIRNSPAV